MNGQRIGYIRVSTVEQHTERQLDGVPVDRTFTDKASGKSLDRPALQEALSYVREGDTLVIHSMDRLARNLDDLRGTVQALTKRGVTVQFMKEGLTFTGNDSPMSKLFLSMLGAFAEFERELLRERQREGIAIAKDKGMYKGRKPALAVEQAEEIRQRATSESKTALAKEYGISRVTLYRYLQEEKA